MDRRDAAAHGFLRNFPEGASFDESRMRVTFALENDEGEEVEYVLPFRYEVCGTCNGRGRHVNPSIDAHGITGEEWSEWSYEEREEYHSGAYDVTCYECGGKNVVPVLDEDGAKPEALRAYRAWIEAEVADRRERESEIRYGY